MKTISIGAKCSDQFSAVLRKDGFIVGRYEGYVPAWLPNRNVQHFGDYVELTIDVDTGHILNWQKPTASDLKNMFKE